MEQDQKQSQQSQQQSQRFDERRRSQEPYEGDDRRKPAAEQPIGDPDDGATELHTQEQVQKQD